MKPETYINSSGADTEAPASLRTMDAISVQNLSSAKSVFVHNPAPRLIPIQKAIALLQLNTLLILVLTYLSEPLATIRLSSFVSEKWQLWLFTSSILVLKFVFVTAMKTQNRYLKTCYAIDLLLNGAIGLLFGVLAESHGPKVLASLTVHARVFLLALFTGLAVLQFFFIAKMKLTPLSSAMLLTVMAVVDMVCMGFATALSDHPRLNIRTTFFGLFGLTIINTYLVLSTHFQLKFREPANNSLGILAIYFRLQSDWSLQFWRDFAKTVGFGRDLASKDPSKEQLAEPPAADNHFGHHFGKETADRVDLSDSDIDDGLSVSALY